MAARAPSSLAAIRLEAAKSNGVPAPQNPNPLPRLSFTKPSLVVKTESNVRKEKRKKPDPPCVVCQGGGRVDCHHCRGRGRTNQVQLAMLPKGEWPKWCRTCGGSGLGYCSRCLGTGEYRYIMGFHFMKMDNDHTQDQKKYEAQGNQERRSAADLLLNEE
ncbi:EMBRYO SAC DEVELOPMENT ARREST 3, chloroplastic [Fagus crenata]